MLKFYHQVPGIPQDAVNVLGSIRLEYVNIDRILPTKSDARTATDIHGMKSTDLSTQENFNLWIELYEAGYH